MVAKEAVVCPKCGALNRRIWPFCARCGESLAGAAPAPEGETETSAAAPEESAGPRPPLGALRILAVSLALVGAGAWAVYSAKHPVGPGPNPALFTIGTSPSPAQPSPPQPSSAPGLAEYRAARAALAKGDLAAALASLEAAVAIDPGNAEYHKEFASALWRSGDTDRSLREQAEAVRLDPRLRLSYARMLDNAGRIDAARAEYEAVLAELPNAATVHQDVGHMLFRNGDYANAALHLQQAVAAQPRDPVLQQELAYALDQTGDHQRAAAVYRDILARAPEAAVTRQHLSENLYQQGQKDEAIAVLKEGLAASPQNALLQRQLGRMLSLCGRDKEATEALKSYLRLAPNAPDAAEVAAKLAAIEGQGKTE